MEKNISDFIQQNSPDGGFLQSEYWRKFQESVGRKTDNISAVDESGELIAYANVIEHSLPVFGKYFYVPRGPVIEKSKIQNFLDDLINLAKKNNAGWIRIEPNNEGELESIKDNLLNNFKIKKSAVDVQPREILVMDISKSEEEILAGMKQKTRYNVKLSQKRGVKISAISQRSEKKRKELGSMNYESGKFIEEFLRLVGITAKRDKITSHPENYYRQMLETIPPEILKLYIAEYEGKVIAVNLVIFFGKTATYMHGASDNAHRNLMAPYLLQWQQIQDAKKAGCARYDFGGIKTGTANNNWSGITKFKSGFAPEVRPVQFPGCYDIILSSAKYKLYRVAQKVKRIF